MLLTTSWNNGIGVICKQYNKVDVCKLCTNQLNKFGQQQTKIYLDYAHLITLWTHFRKSVTTLALGLRSRQGLAKGRANKKPKSYISCS